ncbi:hemolysin-III family protein [Aspergillus tanneri]|uniref:Uncharacterized protein n=1 Tax=Aspergillus tanneri TaxID=1220188 RepID=A0A5M9ME61_9EURO|nr:uncharacterized protein ATNIH1004_009551 [Aspergillus tanneri]KAA8642799.1 hypothetical protein ATNIH1004_009551 [Aspergillus tanneri]
MAIESFRLGISFLLRPVSLGQNKPTPQRPSPPSKDQIFHISQVPEWMQWDPYIVHGYRPQLGSFEDCFWSLFYLHNEFINTWSHLLPGLYFMALLVMAEYWISYVPLDVAFSDILAIQMYMAGSAGCLIFSAAFHATNARSQQVAAAFLKLDYLGIIITISTTCMSVTYFGLYHSAFLQAAYISLTAFCAAIVFWVILDPRMDGVHSGHLRATVFTLLATSGVAPILHVAAFEGAYGLKRFPLESLSVTLTSYAVGTAVYVSRFPEKFWSHRFDLLGASHQIFHVLIVFGHIVHLYGLRGVLVQCSLDTVPQINAAP